MVEYRIVLFPIYALISLIVAWILFSVNWIIWLIFIIFFIINSISSMDIYFKYLMWPYKDMIDTSLVDIQKVEVPSKIKGKNLKAMVVRDKKRDPKEKQIGVLFHHGNTGVKEENLQFIIPLALNGCTVLAIDARGHGESKEEGFNMNDFAGISSDVKNEVSYLEKLEGVDNTRLMMVGHSMGAIATLTYGYKDKRLKKIVSMAGPFDMLEMMNDYLNKKFSVTKIILKTVQKRLLKAANVDAPIAELNKIVSPKYYLEKKHPIPDKDRVFLIQCKNDIVIPYEEALKIKEFLKLPDENLLLLEKPERKYLNAHSFIGQSTIISDFLVKIANSLK